jgi:hypothetical protein
MGKMKEQLGMYRVNDPTYPQVKAGIFTICKQGEGTVWIQCDDGEGVEFSEAAFEKAVAELYSREF